MKKFLLLLLLCAIAMPVWAQEEQEITDETVIYLEDTENNVIRIMTVGEFKDDVKTYDDKMKTEYNASEDNDGNMIIPMHPDYIEALKEQEAIDAYEEESETRGESFDYSYNKNWGIKDYFAAYIDAAITVSGDKWTRELHAHFYAGGTVLKQDIRIVSVNADVTNDTASASFKVLGLCDWSGSQNLSKTFESDEYTIFEYTIIFTIGPVPVKLTAKVTGKVWVTLGIALSGEGLGVMGYVIPGAELNGSMSAEVTVLIASAGIRGEITFLNINMPLTASVYYTQYSGLTMELEVELNLEALKGKIELIIEIGVAWLKKTWTMTLFEWSGIKHEGVIYHKEL
jgi:hypothetical protein